ncbi:hypothetical protein AX14_006001, partial [Amanita brunnescens Koide BX004]
LRASVILQPGSKSLHQRCPDTSDSEGVLRENTVPVQGVRSSVALAGIDHTLFIVLVSTVYAGTSTAQQTDCGISTVRAGSVSKSERTLQLICVLAPQAAHKNAKTVLRLVRAHRSLCCT